MMWHLMVTFFCLISVGCASNPSDNVKKDNQIRIVNCRHKIEVGMVSISGQFLNVPSPTTKVNYICDQEYILDGADNLH